MMKKNSSLIQTIKRRSCEVAILLRKSKYFAKIWNFLGHIWHFWPKCLVALLSSITTKCKQTEEINILNITFDEFFNFSQLQNFDFCGGSPWQKSKQIWTQKVKIRFSISIRFFVRVYNGTIDRQNQTHDVFSVLFM